MTKKDLKNKVTDIQKMGTLELDKFEEILCVSELQSFKKDILFKAIKIRRARNEDIALALIENSEIDSLDEFELWELYLTMLLPTKQP